MFTERMIETDKTVLESVLLLDVLSVCYLYHLSVPVSFMLEGSVAKRGAGVRLLECNRPIT